MTRLRLKYSGLLAGTFILLLTGPALGGGGPENLILAVNARSNASKSIANEYILLRNIPASNVVYLPNVPNEEKTNLATFREVILKPIVEAIDQRGLSRQIDYIVYSADFPTSIDISTDAKIFFERNKVPKPQRRVFRPTASINSLTYFSGAVLAGQPGYMSLKSNLYMRIGTQSMLKRPFVGNDMKTYETAVKHYEDKEFDQAISRFRILAKKHPGQIAVKYYLARALARDGQNQQALVALIEAVRAGWCYRQFTKDDSAFKDMREDSTFQSLLTKIPDESFRFIPPIGFSSR